MTIYEKVSGAWKAHADNKVKVGGAWKDVSNTFIKVGGVWKTVWTAFTPEVALSGTSGSPKVDTDTEPSPTTATAGWQFKSDGTLIKYSGASYTADEWWTGGGAPDQTYYIRATYNAGDANDTGTLGSWLALSANKTWTWTQSAGTKSGSLKIEIAGNSDGSDLRDTGYYGGTAEST
jgi:hypothetical protein